jgi:hypothetical protein
MKRLPFIRLTRLRAHRGAGQRAQRGAASLIVVMVLFFIISLTAAYTSRNLVFEQRTSGNQYRSTLAFEAMDAGIQWALARLNDARMDLAADNCSALTSAGAVNGATPEPSFRERYLNIDGATGNITPRMQGTSTNHRLAGCVFNGSTWSCHCPETGDPDPTFVANGNGPYVAFWVRFPVYAPSRPGVVRVEVNACTRLDPACLSFARTPQTGDGVATGSALMALRSGVASPPAGAVMARGTITIDSGASLNVTNTNEASGGLTVHAGTAFSASTPGLTLTTLPGSPTDRSVVSADPSLALADLSPEITPATPANNGVDRMFNSVFGVWRGTFEEALGVVSVDCSSGCNSGDVNNALLLNPGHAVLLTGGGTLTINADIGSTTRDVLVVSDGQVEWASTPQTVYGLIYSRATNWNLANSGTVRGAIVAESNLRVSGNTTVIYDADVLRRLRVAAGTFVQAPGSWRDIALPP